jgi:hypothetical protein
VSAEPQHKLRIRSELTDEQLGCGNRWSCKIVWPQRTTYFYFRTRWGAERFMRRVFESDNHVLLCQVTGRGAGIPFDMDLPGMRRLFATIDALIAEGLEFLRREHAGRVT